MVTRRTLLSLGLAAAAVAVPSALAERHEFVHVPLGTPTLPYPARKPALVNVYSTAKLPMGIDPPHFIAAMQRYVTEFLGPVWGVEAKMQWSAGPVKGAMNLVITDDTDVEGAIAYHDFDPTTSPTPYGEIGIIQSYENATGDLGVPFSHELGEMLVDPGVNLWAGYSGDWTEDSRLRILEIADPVERTYFLIDGIRVSNFVYPAYFEPWRDGQLDYLKLLTEPNQILPGGYQFVRDRENGTQIVNRGSYLDDGRLCWRVKQLARQFRAR